MKRIIDEVNKIPTDRKCIQEIDIPCFVANIVNTSSNSYGIFSFLENQEDTREWLTNFKNRHISYHNEKVLKLIYDNGIRSKDEEGYPTEDKDIPDSLYIIINEISDEESEKYYIVSRKLLLRNTNYFYIIRSDIYSDMGHRNKIEERVTGYQIVSFKKVVLCEDTEFEVMSNILYLDVM